MCQCLGMADTRKQVSGTLMESKTCASQSGRDAAAERGLDSGITVPCTIMWTFTSAVNTAQLTAASPGSSPTALSILTLCPSVRKLSLSRASWPRAFVLCPPWPQWGISGSTMSHGRGLSWKSLMHRQRWGLQKQVPRPSGSTSPLGLGCLSHL